MVKMGGGEMKKKLDIIMELINTFTSFWCRWGCDVT